MNKTEREMRKRLDAGEQIDTTTLTKAQERAIQRILDEVREQVNER